MIIMFKKRKTRDYGSILWPVGILSVGLLIVAFMTLSMSGKPTTQQTQVADTIVKLLKEPSTTGSGFASP
jgi:hypothetical protein